MKIVYSATNYSIKIELSTVGRDAAVHEDDTLLTPEVRAEIVTRFNEGMKPKKIRMKLLEMFGAGGTPNLKSVQNCVHRLRKKIAPSKPFTDVDLIEYANQHSAVPEDENAVFVAGFTPYGQDKHFVVVWSTPKLIQVQHEGGYRCVDNLRFIQVDHRNSRNLTRRRMSKSLSSAFYPGPSG